MKLGELIEDLQAIMDAADENSELEVMAEYDYGDHCHTRALTRLSYPEIIVPRKTAYSDSGLAVSDKDEDGDEEGGERIVALLR